MWNRTENQIEEQVELFLIRHGETTSNKEHRYLGITEEDLCEDGIVQLKENKSLGLYQPVDMVFTSPMKRCVQTAELIYPKNQYRKISSWREMNFGDFEGKNYQELQNDNRYQAWIDSNGTLPFPGGETREDFIIRCRQGLEEVLAEVQEKKNQITSLGLILHGGTIMALLSSYAGGDYFDYQVENARGYHCQATILETQIKITDVMKL